MDLQAQNEIAEYCLINFSDRTPENEKRLAILHAIYYDPFIVNKFDFIQDEVYVSVLDQNIKVASIKPQLYAIISNAINAYIKSWQIIKDGHLDTYILKLTFNVEL